MSYLATRLAAVKPSASMAASMAAKALRARGLDVIDLGLGEPDFPTPPHVADAAHRAASAGETLYTPAAGTPALRAAVAEKFRRENGLDLSPDEIVVANGAKQIIFNALMATLNEGDEALYRQLTDRFGNYFEGAMGAAAIQKRLQSFDL